MFYVGEMVVRRRSKAKILKRRIYKVINELPSSSYSKRYRVVDAYGKLHELPEYLLRTSESHKQSLQATIDVAKNAAIEAGNELHRFNRDLGEVMVFFPSV